MWLCSIMFMMIIMYIFIVDTMVNGVNAEVTLDLSHAFNMQVPRKKHGTSAGWPKLFLLSPVMVLVPAMWLQPANL